MFEAPIYERVLQFKNKNPRRFFMPGHKGGYKFGSNYLSPVMPYDLTELPRTGNLYGDSDIFDEAGRLAARAFCARQSFLLCNGATQGICAALSIARRYGDKILIDRNCHKSVITGIMLLGFEPYYIKSRILDWGFTAGVEDKDVAEGLKLHPDAAAVVITSPTYYGVISDIARIKKECEAQGNHTLLIVDEAHGAHLNFSPSLPESAIALGADIVISSAHKTLPALTQGAFLNVNIKIERSEVLSAIAMFGSSSPSYLISASLDWARAYMEQNGEEELDKLVSLCTKTIKKLNSTNKLKCMDADDALKEGIIRDPTRIII